MVFYYFKLFSFMLFEVFFVIFGYSTLGSFIILYFKLFLTIVSYFPLF